MIMPFWLLAHVDLYFTYRTELTHFNVNTQVFVEFRGHELSPGPLLRHSGLLPVPATA